MCVKTAPVFQCQQTDPLSIKNLGSIRCISFPGVRCKAGQIGCV